MKNYTKEQKLNITKTVVTAAVLLVMSIGSLIIPLRPSVSETEKRELAKFPDFTVSALLDGSYFSDISLWFSDTVPFRDYFVSANSKIQNFLGTSRVQLGFSEGNKGDEIPDVPDNIQTETTTQPPVTQESTTAPPVTEPPVTEPPVTEAPTTLLPETTTALPESTTAQGQTESTTHSQAFSSIYIHGNAGYEYYHFNQSATDGYIAAVNQTADKLLGKANVYCMVIPTSIDIVLPEAIRAKLSVSDQSKAINYMLGSMNDNVRKINIYPTLKNHSGEYLYFRTDHHWTALGAYYAYTDFCNTKGISALPLNSYGVLSFDGFLGSFYTDSGMNPALSATPDRVDAYVPPCNTVMTVYDKNGNPGVHPLIYNVSGNAASNKYGCFIFGDNPFTIIDNTDMAAGESCLVIKESFGNCFVPFLASHYKYVYVMDFRYSPYSIMSLVDAYGINDVIFCNNISMTRSTSMVNTLLNHIG
ncbi:MAG: hypothetical protein IJE93_04725 [Clostridia bacterium]|nr:hypothetical protein [Clostridia bacterium]